MNRILRVSLAAAAGLLVLVGTGCDKLRSRDELNKGVAAYKNAKYAEAIDRFKSAIALDPTNPNAKLYLATAYMTQWIPGADSPENKQLAEQAKKEFSEVLQKDPNDKIALASLASLAYNQSGSLQGDEKLKMLDEARDWNSKLIQADPKNKEAYYSLGVIAWSKWYPELGKARADLGMKPEDPGPLKDKKLRESLKEKYTAVIDEGISNLNKALEVDPEYDDAMAYLNLLVREKADLADNGDQYKEQIKVADDWVQKALETKKKKAARQPGNVGITQEEKK
ncbi:MAG: tetratricopeptide repeat protein [Acidobacteria bacterium]|nr:tetratricopeptide repeat protein [Acidobacteriota bacterium]